MYGPEKEKEAVLARLGKRGISGEEGFVKAGRYILLGSEPENGKAKDPVRRLHALLIPYDELSEEEKAKDRENIRVLLSVRN